MYQIFEERFSINYCGRNAFHLLLKVMIKQLDIKFIKLFHFLVVFFAFLQARILWSLLPQFEFF
jgi:hypothetical protein